MNKPELEEEIVMFAYLQAAVPQPLPIHMKEILDNKLTYILEEKMIEAREYGCCIASYFDRANNDTADEDECDCY